MNLRPIAFAGRHVWRGSIVLARCGAIGLVASGVWLAEPAPAFAEPPAPLVAQEPSPELDESPTLDPSKEIRLDGAPGFSLGLGAYGGLTLLMTEEGSRPHTVVGALSRARYGYAELGALLELTERNPEQWRSIGGFAGAALPYRNWVELELAGGFAYRRYVNSDPRYGAGGYDVRAPSLFLRLGISDRSSKAALGARFGGELVLGMDIGRREASWRYDLGTGADAKVYRGTTPVGGVSIGLAVSAGFDIAFKADKSRSARALSTPDQW